MGLPVDKMIILTEQAFRLVDCKNYELGFG
jgi:hypothetical protein